MRKMTALWTLTMLVSLLPGATAAEKGNRAGHSVDLSFVNRMEAPPQAAAPQWKSRDEYDAYNAMASAPDPTTVADPDKKKALADKKIALAEAFLQKYPTSDFKSGAYLTEMQVYFSQGKTDQAIDAAKKVLSVDPDNLLALRFLSFTFPFLYKPGQADDTAALSRADSDAHHGLDLINKLQKPAAASDADFQKGVKDFRSVFNDCIGFVALQRKDYSGAITALKAGDADNPSDVYAFYRLGLAYLYSAPPDYDNAIWNIARAVALSQASTDPATKAQGDEISKFLKRAYVNYHGTDTGLTDIEAQAAASPNPPAGFKIAKAEAPAKTGNNVVDAFNTLTFPLKLGGETAQKQWDGIKGQPIELGGAVMSVEKGTDPNVYAVHIAVLDSTKSADGYDIELKDSTQPNVKNLQKGDLLTYKGTLDSYVATPGLVLTLVGTVTSELPDKPPAKTPPAKPKPPVHPPVHKPTPPPSS
jgi:tetratricopeptide (TPR) repeat protein